ncbi:UDP-Glycosyltransferase/glycogen phosphorylase [Trametes punicea]|nr:UDP-Glycosyltransferase/glycogen phosphorylase [Trametes punicea]
MTGQETKHILLLPVHMWGHVRPLCIAAARMVKLRPMVTLTVCIASRMLNRARTEVTRDFAPGDDCEPLSRIRMIPIDEGTETLDAGPLLDSFLALWRKLCGGESVSCKSIAGGDHTFNLRTAPLSAVLIDAVAVEVFMALQKQRETSLVPLNLNLYNWLPVATNSILPLYGEDPLPLAEAMAERGGISFNDAAHAIFAVPKGRVVSCPGLPPMYDHELAPQAVGLSPDSLSTLTTGLMFHQIDGVLTMDAAEYHPEVTSALREWFGERGQKIYYAGPLLARTDASNGVRPGEDGQRDVLRFLDEQLKTHGARSVVYVSFGSMFWPLNTAKLVAVLEVLMEQNVPFVVTRPSPFASISEAVMERLAQYGGAFVANWVPQHAVLNHPATGWCLTHGGHNTVLECILACVPMIIWPIMADQPTNAIHLTDQLEIAYELLEVRNGTGLGPIFRKGRTLVGTLDAVRDEVRDVLVRAFGEDGEAKRARILALRGRLLDAWAEEEGEEGKAVERNALEGGDGQERGRIRGRSKGIGRREVEAFLDEVCALTPFTVPVDIQTTR